MLELARMQPCMLRLLQGIVLYGDVKDCLIRSSSRTRVNVVQTMPSALLYISFSNTSNSQTHNYALMVFVDFSSAFNTIQPHVLLEKMKVNNPFIIKLIVPFFSDWQITVCSSQMRSSQLRTSSCLSRPKALSF